MSRKRAAHPSTLRRLAFRLADGSRTGVALEPAFWAVLGRIAAARGLRLGALVRELRAARAPGQDNLASALRVHALLHAPRVGPAREPAPAAPATVARGRQTAASIAAINSGRRRPPGA